MNTSPESVPAWAAWLAFHIGHIRVHAHGLTSGRDALREIRARFDALGAPEEQWEPLERAALDGGCAISQRVDVTCMRAMQHLAGPQPMGPNDRLN